MPLVRAEELGYVTSGFEEVDPLVVLGTAVLYTGERSLVYVELPEVGKAVEQNKPMCVVESVKSASDVVCPISGEITEVNSELIDHP